MESQSQDEQILAGIRDGSIAPLGGYTSDTAWGIVYSDGRYLSWRYDEEYQKVFEEITEAEVLSALESSGLKRRILESLSRRG